MSRIAIYIDGAYLDHILRDDFNLVKIDYSKLSQAVAGNIEILRTYYYHCLPYKSATPTLPESEKFSNMEKFLFALRRLQRYEIRLGRIAHRGIDKYGNPIFEQKRVDVLFSTDLVSLSATRQISHAALICGDSDMIPAVQVAKQNGVLISLWCGTKNPPHQDLWDECDERNVITQEFIKNILRP